MRLLTWFALGLWVVTIAGAAFVLMRGQTMPSEDGRTIIKLSAGEQTFVLAEMRGLLDAVQGVVLGLDDNDTKAVAAAVEGKGLEDMQRATPISIMAKVPMPFRQLGHAMHQGFTDIGNAAKSGAGRDKILALLGEQLGRCTACHASYRLPR